MNKKQKERLRVFLTSSFLAGAALGLSLFLPDESVGIIERICGGMLSALWAFGCVPSYLFCWRWLNERDVATSFSYGYFFKLSGLFVPLILAPIGLIFYCVKDE